MLKGEKIELFVWTFFILTIFIINYLTFGYLNLDFEKAYAPTLPIEVYPFFEDVTA